MSTTNETGYAKVVSGFETFVQRCQQFGTTYNPSNARIQLDTLTSLLADARAALLAVNTAKNNYNNATNTREIAFSGLRKFATRIVNALVASGAPQQTIDDARFIIAKLNGKRRGTASAPAERTITPTDVVVPTTSSGPGSTPAAGGITRSVSQIGYDALLDNFTKLVLIATSEPTYAPNESELQVTALNTLLSELQGKISAVIIAETTWHNARLQRETVFHGALTGLVDVARQAKGYIRSVFGATSAQYKQVSHIFIK